MNDINVGEVYYIVARARSPAQAEEFVKRLEILPIQLISNSFADVLDAARIKARLVLSYADAFVVATAVRENAIIVTRDPEFRQVEKLVSIEWL